MNHSAIRQQKEKCALEKKLCFRKVSAILKKNAHLLH